MRLQTPLIHQVNRACSLNHVVYLLLSQLKVNSLFLQVDFPKLVQENLGATRGCLAF